ncbi:DNA cytosine methyltransferase [Pendulispora brunnea]|uniref:DNA (cytosine-5-)-methyltransferase n=1 Tax=Pendulispora brunnea TaxID=2905690 RepID=A0ABZ2KI37_9BACT
MKRRASTAGRVTCPTAPKPSSEGFSDESNRAASRRARLPNDGAQMSLVIDSFAGGGGASLGITMALGRGPDVAINHDPEALALHAVNHSRSRHLCENVLDVDPLAVCGNQHVALMWSSPDCKHFSRAKGAKPVSTGVRGLAWVVVRWARAVHPDVVILENVPEFTTWGPLLPNNMPDPARRGLTFKRWWGQLRAAGYELEMRVIAASDYGAPTTRRRLFIVARSDGRRIVWPEPTHGPGRRHPYRTAADCIQWDVPCPSIFERTRPLAAPTMNRIARGIRRFVLNAGDPFLLPTPHGGDARVHSVDEPLRTVTGAHRGENALAAATLIQTGYGERAGRAPRALNLRRPVGTVVAGGSKHGLIAAYLAKHFGGHESPGGAMSAPFSAVTCRDHHALVTAKLGAGRHRREVRALMGGPAIVKVGRDTFEIVDIGMRMLGARELFRAQGFPDHYAIDVTTVSGRPLSKTAQIRMAGNAVCPPVAAALVAANVRLDEEKGRAA